MGQETNVKAVVLAGAQDWGNCPLRLACPRPLVPIANQPVLAHLLSALRDAGVTDIVLCANGYTRAFRRALGSGADLGVNLSFSEDQMPRGPAGCVQDSAPFLGESEVIVVDGSIVPRLDFRQLIDAHQKSEALLTVATDSTGAPREWAAGFGPAPIGIYLFSREVREMIPAKGYQDIKEGLLPRLYAEGRHVAIAPIDGAAPRVMGPESYLTINAWAVEHLAASDDDAPEGYERHGEALVHSTATVAPSARLVGPVMVGPHSKIGKSAVVIGATTVGADCEVGDFAVVSRAALWDRVSVGAGAQVEQSILCPETAVPPGRQVINAIHLEKNLSPAERATLSARYAVSAVGPKRQAQTA